MIVNAEIEVERDDEMVLVNLCGKFEYFSSYSPNENGLHLIGYDSFDYQTQNDIKLTKSEKHYAEEQLYKVAGEK